ncbi:sortase [Nocardioides ungokensis]|uniref:sortase n=1 Tax=Nocardioides ungokensis TaxID=1643322 RepID=UPI0015DE9283|nr:sortase [Nocardioides ungokensis]
MRRLLAAVLVVGGCALLAFLLLRPAVDSQHTAQAQERLADQLSGGPAPAVPAGRSTSVPVAQGVGVGEALMTMRVPRFGADWSWVAVEGTGLAQIAEGPGHYRSTPLPGARGNVALAGHRAGHGSPFLNFDALRPGDDVVLEQRGVRWTYRLATSPRIIPVDATWVLGPSTDRELTLTTCWPRYGSSKRMYVRARLARVDEREAAGWSRTWRSDGPA